MIIAEDGLVEKLARDLLCLLQQQEIPTGIGVHSGVAYFGTMGTAEGLTDISAIGNEVNLAALLASKAAAGEIILSLSEQALREAGIDGSELESRSLVLKGIAEPMIVRVTHNS